RVRKRPAEDAGVTSIKKLPTTKCQARVHPASPTAYSWPLDDGAQRLDITAETHIGSFRSNTRREKPWLRPVTQPPQNSFTGSLWPFWSPSSLSRGQCRISAATHR